jgi:soluble lytic murein transglycosylase-like protein
MQQHRTALLIFGATAVATMLVIGAYLIGRHGAASVIVVPPSKIETASEAPKDDRIEKINALVAERNANAKLGEFQGFAETLLHESDKAGIDYRLILAIIEKESRFDPQAIGSMGEIGLMQLMPDTAKLIAEAMHWPFIPPVKAKHKGKNGPRYESLGSLANPSFNVRVGILHLRGAVNQFGMTAVALRAYNRGDKYAKQHRPSDRYAEDIAWNVVAALPKF